MFRKLIKLFLLTLLIYYFLFAANSVHKAQSAPNLAGRILLQVQAKGQAWYVNPANQQRYYLGRPRDAFELMRTLGLGISNQDFNRFKNNPPSRLLGKILLKVEDKGQAYYVNPVNKKLYYLGRPADAFKIMRNLGLGITNSDLDQITIALGEKATSNNNLRKFSFKYQNNNYEIVQRLSSSIYNSYQHSPKTYSYPVGSRPTNIRDAFYGLFLKARSDDNSIAEIIAKSKKIAQINNWDSDQLLAFVLALVQYIPYDYAKLKSNTRVAYYPYETLYLDSGICSDKTFLALVFARQLGYGAAILDFPDIDHTALGIACPVEYSINNSGYCYVETTNYFPLGVIPQNISGQAQISVNNYDNLFDSTGLGKIEIEQETQGKVYQGISQLKARIKKIKTTQLEISSAKAENNSLNTNLEKEKLVITKLKTDLDTYLLNNQIAAYNSLVVDYNAKIKQYNTDLNSYRLKITEYNQKINLFNQLNKDFYQH